MSQLSEALQSMLFGHAPGTWHWTLQRVPPQVIAPQLLPSPQTIEQLLACEQSMPPLQELVPWQST
jgi:hypothetical protein